MSYLVCAAFVVLLAASAASNPDIMSPAKFFLLSFAMFHAGALARLSDYEMWMLIGIVLLAGAATVLFEDLGTPVARSWPTELRALRVGTEKPFVAWLWALSIPALIAQTYVVVHFGGIDAYINIVGNRVIEFRGMGWVKTLIAMMTAFNLFYFSVGLTRPRSRAWWSAYVLHALLLLLMGVLSGSRSGLLSVFAMQVFCYHYIRRRARLVLAIPAAALLLLAAILLGLARNGLKIEHGEVVTGLDNADSTTASSTFNYGVTPLTLLVNADQLRLAHGSTILSVATNVVPRDWWPDKPDSGGVFFTKAYANDEWDGASNLTPTFLGEWIINFGWVPGILCFLIAYPMVMYLVVRLYVRTMRRLQFGCDAATAVDVVLYIVVMWAAVALMVGEITNVVLNIAITQVIPLVAMRRLLVARPATSSQRPAVVLSASTCAADRISPGP